MAANLGGAVTPANAKQPPTQIMAKIALQTENIASAGKSREAESALRAGVGGTAWKTIRGVCTCGGGLAAWPPQAVTDGAETVTDEVTITILKGVLAPGVTLTGHGLNEHVVNSGRFDGHANVTFSPFAPKTLSATITALNVTVPPCMTVSSEVCPLASATL